MKFQIGKSGITEGAIATLQSMFKNSKVVRVSVLKNFSPDRNKIKEIAEELKSKLQGKFKSTIIGFTIILRKQGTKIKQGL